MTFRDLQIGEAALRARYNHSDRTRRDWVLYVHDVETLRRIAKGESLI